MSVNINIKYLVKQMVIIPGKEELTEADAEQISEVLNSVIKKVVVLGMDTQEEPLSSVDRSQNHRCDASTGVDKKPDPLDEKTPFELILFHAKSGNTQDLIQSLCKNYQQINQRREQMDIRSLSLPQFLEDVQDTLKTHGVALSSSQLIDCLHRLHNN